MQEKTIGYVLVNSGNLIVVDPGTVKTFWKNEGRPISLKFWGEDMEKAAEMLSDRLKKHNLYQRNGAYIIESSGDDMVINNIDIDLTTLSQQFGYKVVWAIEHDTSYTHCTRATKTPELGGQVSLNPEMLPGAPHAVAFQSGYGDGQYPVKAIYDDDGNISKIEIIFE